MPTSNWSLAEDLVWIWNSDLHWRIYQMCDKYFLLSTVQINIYLLCWNTLTEQYMQDSRTFPFLFLFFFFFKSWINISGRLNYYKFTFLKPGFFLRIFFCTLLVDGSSQPVLRIPSFSTFCVGDLGDWLEAEAFTHRCALNFPVFQRLTLTCKVLLKV